MTHRETAPPVLSIIIANYNARAALAGCLASIETNPPDAPYEVLVVDDASADGSADMVRARFPRVRLLVNERNLNYGGTTARSRWRAGDIFIS